MTYQLTYRTVYMPVRATRVRTFRTRGGLDRFVRLNNVTVLDIQEMSE